MRQLGTAVQERHLAFEANWTRQMHSAGGLTWIIGAGFEVALIKRSGEPDYGHAARLKGRRGAICLLVGQSANVYAPQPAKLRGCAPILEHYIKSVLKVLAYLIGNSSKRNRGHGSSGAARGE